MRNAGLEETQAGIKISGRNINKLRYADNTTLMAESEEKLKSLLISMKEEWRRWLKTQHSKNEDHGIWSHHFTANRWGNNGNSDRLFSWAPKITVDSDCNHEIKRCLLFGRKAITNLDSILKCRDMTLSTKVCIVKGMVIPVITYGCESWTIKKAEDWRIDAFKLWCWRGLSRRSNQSILKETNWIVIGRTDGEAETQAPVLWPPDVKSQLTGKDWC